MEYEMSERHACRLVGLARSTNRHRVRKAGRDAALRTRLKELAATRMRFGYSAAFTCGQRRRKQGWSSRTGIAGVYTTFDTACRTGS